MGHLLYGAGLRLRVKDIDFGANQLVALQVAAQEREVRQQVKTAGGKWNPREGVWELPYGQVVALGLTDRIVTPRERRVQASHLPVDGRRQEHPSTNR